MIVLLLIVNLAGLLAVMWHASTIIEAQEEEISRLRRRVERLEEKQR